MFGIGFDEIFVVLIIFLLFFNPKEWPEIAKKTGNFYKWFSKEITDINSFLHNQTNSETIILKKNKEDEKQNCDIL